jgi:2-dehydro-3-deoxygluconokinase
MGVFYLEAGANQRSSKVIYDRANSAIALAKAGDFDWDRIFSSGTWFHITGITPAISAATTGWNLLTLAVAPDEKNW